MSVLSVPLALLAGCDPGDGGPGADPAPGSEVTAKEVEGDLLYERTIAPGHTVQMWDFGNGSHGIREQTSLDQPHQAIFRNVAIQSLADAFARLNPEIKLIPTDLLAADRRAEQARSLRPERAPASVPEPTSAPNSAAIQSAACSADAYGDNWGAQWFESNWCGGLPLANTCRTNWQNFATGDRRRNHHQYHQMEGDFNVPGHIVVTLIQCTLFRGCTKKRDVVNQPVAPRTIVTWSWVDSADTVSFSGFSRCGHGHASWYNR